MSDCPICENPAHLNFHPSSPFVELNFRAAALMELVEDQLPRVKYAATLPSSIVLGGVWSSQSSSSPTSDKWTNRAYFDKGQPQNIHQGLRALV